MKKILAPIMVITLALILQFPIGNNAFASEQMDLSKGSWTISSSDKKAQVSWDFSDSTSRIELFREGHLVAVGPKEGIYVVPEVQPGDSLDFQIHVRSALSPDEVSNLQVTLNKSASEVKKSIGHFEGAGLNLRVPFSGFSQRDSAEAAVSMPDYTILRYTTFIRNSTVEAANGFCAPAGNANYRFRGDNRGFSPTSNSFRSRFDVRVNWSNGTAISPTRTIGRTVREVYDTTASQWKFDASAVASNESMDLTLIGTQTSNHATFNIKQDPKDPFCQLFGLTANGIYFDFDFSIWRASSYSYSGTARVTPDHELYLKDSDQTSWNVLFQKESQTFDCLNPILSPWQTCIVARADQGTR